jgi:hypothetical protein
VGSNLADVVVSEWFLESVLRHGTPGSGQVSPPEALADPHAGGCN